VSRGGRRPRLAGAAGARLGRRAGAARGVARAGAAGAGRPRALLGRARRAGAPRPGLLPVPPRRRGVPGARLALLAVCRRHRRGGRIMTTRAPVVIAGVLALALLGQAVRAWHRLEASALVRAVQVQMAAL